MAKRKFRDFVAGLAGLLEQDAPDLEGTKGVVEEELRTARLGKRLRYALKLATLRKFLMTRDLPESGAMGRKGARFLANKLVAAGLFDPLCLARKSMRKAMRKGGRHA